MDIHPPHVDIIIKILDKNLSAHSKIWVFGSRATHAKKQFSDLDLAIDSLAKLPLSVLSSLEHDFSESDLPYKVDIVDLNNIDPSFREKIMSDRVFFGKSELLNL